MNQPHKMIPQYPLLSEQQASDLLKFIDSQPWNKDLNRLTQQYGYKYDYKLKSLNPAPPLPDVLLNLRAEINKVHPLINGNIQCIINNYEAGQSISAHIDNTGLFGPQIAVVSLLSPATMIFKSADQQQNVILQPDHCYILEGEYRYRWTHELAKLKDRRISITFRTLK